MKWSDIKDGLIASARGPGEKRPAVIELVAPSQAYRTHVELVAAHIRGARFRDRLTLKNIQVTPLYSRHR